MNVAAYQEKKVNEKTGKREREKKRENSRPISKRLLATLLQAFRGQQGEKMVCMREYSL